MRGSHGTCKSFAQSIGREGFKAGSQGRLGKGIYFWVFAENERGENLGRDLARIWFDFATRSQLYSDAQAKSCAVIFVNIAADYEDSALDFDDDEVRSDFAKFYDSIKGRFKKLEQEEITSIRDEFVATMEQVRDAKYDLILGMVDIPHGKLPANHFAKIERRSRCAAVQNNEIIDIYRIEGL